MQDKSESISEMSREILSLREELKELKLNNQVMEKRLLKTQEDYEVVKSKLEMFKDIEIVHDRIICHYITLIIIFCLIR